MSASWVKFHDLYAHLRQHFQLDWNGVHGITHWSRVYTNARKLAAAEHALDPGAEIYDTVLQLFAFLHDHERWNDYSDPSHGHRAAFSARQLRGKFFEVSDHEMKLLEEAMIHHSAGITVHWELTVAICWDADRLDLARVGTTPNPAFLCTRSAKDPRFIAACVRRSKRAP